MKCQISILRFLNCVDTCRAIFDATKKGYSILPQISLFQPLSPNIDRRSPPNVGIASRFARWQQRCRGVVPGCNGIKAISEYFTM